MERQKNTLIIFSSILVVLHFVGLLGLSYPLTRPLFTDMVPHFLWVSAFLIIFPLWKGMGLKSLLIMLLIPILGIGIEYLGTKTGLLFGEYSYGKTLGIGVGGVPFVIGVNWLILCIGAWCYFDFITSRLLRVVMGATSLVILDYFIEPVAIALDFWSWSGNVIPNQNYFTWFIVATIFLAILSKIDFPQKRYPARTFFLCQVLFFILLGIIL